MEGVGLGVARLLWACVLGFTWRFMVLTNQRVNALIAQLGHTRARRLATFKGVNVLIS